MNLRRVASQARGILKILRRQALILIYHRVAEVDLDPWDLAVRPAHFAQQLEVLGRVARPMSLRDLVRSIERGRIPRRAVVVTFDDGYADNLLLAKPILERFGIPATAFLTAGKLGSSEGFWWDELTSVFLRPGTLPEVLEIVIEGRAHRWELGESCRYGEQDARREQRWRGWYQRLPTPRHRAFVELFSLLQPLGEEARMQIMGCLRSWAGGRREQPLDARILTREEAARLADGALVEIGSHTLTHSRLSTLTERDKKAEIHRSREVLEEIASGPVTSFAFPFGQPDDYDAASVAIVREAGFRAACSNVPGAVTVGRDLFQLPRHYVSDCDGEEFARQWAVWQRA